MNAYLLADRLQHLEDAHMIDEFPVEWTVESTCSCVLYLLFLLYSPLMINSCYCLSIYCMYSFYLPDLRRSRRMFYL